MSTFVKVLKVNDINDANQICKSAYEVIKAVMHEDVKGKKILLKPNTGFDGKAKSGLCTHPEVIRGIIRYFKDNFSEKIYVGDSSVIGVKSLQALKSAGIYDVCQEENVTCLDLNESGPIEKKIENGYVVDSILLSNILFDVDIIVCVPVMKTHMYTGASLGIKNMKGGMYKREKNKLHRLTKSAPEGREEKALDFGILDLTTVLYPHYVVTDGIVGMEGFGPSGGTSKHFGCICASACAVSCDMVTLKLMGIELEDVGHVKLLAEQKQVNYRTIQVDPPNYIKWKSDFITPSQARLALNCEKLEYVDESACSGCHATLTQFLRYHADKFSDGEKITIFAGKDIDPEEIKARGKNAYLVGACTAKYKDLAPFCQGCPPVTSEMLKMIWNMYGVTINALENDAVNLQTMNYKILINPYNALSYEKIKSLEPTHICLFDEKNKDIATKLDAEVYACFEGEKIITSEFRNVLKTEFGFVKLLPSINNPKSIGALSFGIESINIVYVYDEHMYEFDEGIDVLIFDKNVENDFVVRTCDEIKPKQVVAIGQSNEAYVLWDAVKALGVGEHFTYSNQVGNAIANAKVVSAGVL